MIKIQKSIFVMFAILAVVLTPLTSVIPANATANTVTITVNSDDLGGNAITGMFIELQNTSGADIATGYTPVSFSVTSGQQYVVYANNYQNFVFNHWDDGTTNQARSITSTQSATLTAYYSTGSAATAPGSPTALTATAASSSQINLSWTAPSNNGGSAITGYKIERSTDGGTTWSTIQSNTGSTSTTYSDTGLAASTTYTYRVSAINSVGTSSPSNTASATTSSGGTGGTIVINNIQKTSGTVSSSPYQITLSNFNAGTTSNSLLVVGVEANNNVVSSVTFGGIQLTKAISSFSNNDAEFWYLVNPSGTGNILVTMAGSTSVVVGAYSISGVDQTTPVPTTATNHNTAAGSPNVSITTKYANSLILDSPSIYGGVTLGSPTCTQEWNTSISNAITGASSSTIVSSPGAATCSWTASGSGDLYDDVAIEVKASSTGGTATVPGSPTNLVASAISSSQINLSWAAPANNGGSAITGYKIERSTNMGITWSTIQSNTGSTSTTYSDTGLSANTSYTYRVSAINSVGASSPSNTASATTSSGGTSTPPGSPTALTATTASSSQINLSWTAPANNGGSAITGYKIERSTDGGTTWSTIQSNTGSTSTTYSDTGLAASTTYTYRVSAINSVGTSSPSNTASATTQPVTTGPNISLNTNTVNVGTDVRVTGTNFASNSQITISFDSTAIGIGSNDISSGTTTPSTITTDSNGNFVGILSVLTSVQGTHAISAQDTAKHKASQSVTVAPHVFIFPLSGHAGSTVQIPASQGNGFAASSAITIKFDGSTVTPTSAITTDSSGNCGGSFMVPSSATLGPHQITVSDAKGNSYTNSFNVTASTTPTYSSQIVATGLNFPAYFAFIPDNGPGVDGSGAFMVNEKNTGNVIVFKNVNGMFTRQSVPFVTVPNLQVNYETNGLLGIALDPNWVTSKMVYFYVTRTVSGSVVGEVIRYHATTDSAGNIVADSSVGEQLILGNIPDFNNGHNGGSLKFDSQGNLYVSTGDGWTFTAGQDLTTLQAKILKITPLASPVNGKMYSIPSTNPFASSTNTSIKKEIWAYGVRNPYTFDIDSQTGRIYISDPGFNTWERIEDVTTGGSNAGWSNYESPSFGNPQNVANYVSPPYWYPHQGVEPLTGSTSGLEALSAGAFYHGNNYPNLQGAYFFGDYGVGDISALLPSSVAPPTTDSASGYPIGKVVPILYGLTEAPIYMQEWNGKMYFLDLSGNVNVLNYS